MTTSDCMGYCLICNWVWKAPAKKRCWGSGVAKELSPEQRQKILEENILAHLRDAHDRMMLTREDVPSKEPNVAGKSYYHGRRPVRER